MPSSNKSPLSTTIKSLTCGLILSQFVWGIPGGIYKWGVCGRGVRGQYRRLAGSKCWKRVASVRLRRCVVCKETQSSRCEKREPLSCRILPLVRNRNSVKRTNGHNHSLTSTGMTGLRLLEEVVLRVRSFCPCLFTMSTATSHYIQIFALYSNIRMKAGHVPLCLVDSMVPEGGVKRYIEGCIEQIRKVSKSEILFYHQCLL